MDAAFVVRLGLTVFLVLVALGIRATSRGFDDPHRVLLKRREEVYGTAFSRPDGTYHRWSKPALYALVVAAIVYVWLGVDDADLARG